MKYIINSITLILTFIKNFIYTVLGLIIIMYIILAPSSVIIPCMILLAIYGLGLSFYENFKRYYDKNF